MDEYICAYCGADLLAEPQTEPLVVLWDEHIESCEPFQQRLASKFRESPLCDGDEE